MYFIRPNIRIHDPELFLEHTKKALDHLIEIIDPAIARSLQYNVQPLSDSKKYPWRFPDAVETEEDVTQIFALVLIIWRELEEAIEIFDEDFVELELANTLRTAACHLDTYVSDLELENLIHLQAATMRINEVLRVL